MTLSATQIRQIMLTQEGWSLERVNDHGITAAAEISRAQIDGHMNALIRIEGSKSAAQFAFALSDRVVGGLKEPTDCHEISATPIMMPPAAPKPTDRAWQWRSYSWGFFHGMLALAFMTFWRMH